MMKRLLTLGIQPTAQPMTTVLMETPPTLADAQALVGGVIEVVSLPHGDQLLCDADAIDKGLPWNRLASRMADTYIVGPVLVLIGPARWPE
jgi:hypothetical protein